MYNHNKAQQSKNRVHISWDILYQHQTPQASIIHEGHLEYSRQLNRQNYRSYIFSRDTLGFKFVRMSFQTMMTSSNGNIFGVTGHLCGEFTGPGEFPLQRPVTRSFDVFFDVCLNKRLSKQSWGWWFETPSCPLWRQCNVLDATHGTF